MQDLNKLQFLEENVQPIQVKVKENFKIFSTGELLSLENWVLQKKMRENSWLTHRHFMSQSVHFLLSFLHPESTEKLPWQGGLGTSINYSCSKKSCICLLYVLTSYPRFNIIRWMCFILFGLGLWCFLISSKRKFILLCILLFFKKLISMD